MDPTQNSKHDGKTPEDYKEYKQKWDKQRRNTQSERQNMEFFIKILKSLKLNYKQFSELTGISQQLVSWWLTSDDCKYSNIISCFDKLGIDIACHYEPIPGGNFVINEDDYSIQIDSLPELGQTQDAELGQVIDQVLSGNGKLRFLAELIDGLKMDIKSFSQHIGSSYHVVYSWFRKDDIKISKIYATGDQLQQKVVWTVKKKDDSQTDQA